MGNQRFTLEFKHSKLAVKQIEDRKYDIGITGNVIYIGLAHYQKDVEIEWKEN